MQLFYAYTQKSDGRFIIDDSAPNVDCLDIETKTVDCWLAAKKAFGYELSPVQEYLLDKFRKPH